jgi:hypothetical protein
MSIGQGALISLSSYLRNAKGSDLLNIKKVKGCLRAQELWISPQKLRRRLVLGLNPNSYRELSVSTGKLSEKDFRLSHLVGLRIEAIPSAKSFSSSNLPRDKLTS